MLLQAILPVAFAAIASAQSQTLVQAIAGQSSLSTLQTLLSSQPGLVQVLSTATGITILAPNNDAFSKFLATAGGKAASAKPDVVAALLSYHVLNASVPASGFTATAQFVPTLLTNTTYTNVTGGQVVQGQLSNGKVQVTTGLKEKSTVLTADIAFQGGVMHIIDTVLTIPLSDAESAIDSQLTGLAGALTKTNLVSTVDGLKDVTIFAPSNAAFQAIGATAEKLTDQQLSSILTYHVITPTVGYSTLLVTGLANQSFPTVNGESLAVLVEDNKVFVNGAQVVITDIIVSNGVMHVINNVLNPANATATPVVTATSQPIAFSGAASATNVPFTSGISATTTGPAGKSTGAAAKPTFAAMGAAALFGGAAAIAANL